jgi:50S ribosomal subunit-associated GTPase HflX
MLEVPHSFVDNGTCIYISAVTGEGLDTLLETVENEIGKLFFRNVTYNISAQDGKSLAWLHSHGKVTSQHMEDTTMVVNVQLSEDNIRRFEHMYAKN